MKILRNSQEKVRMKKDNKQDERSEKQANEEKNKKSTQRCKFFQASNVANLFSLFFC